MKNCMTCGAAMPGVRATQKYCGEQCKYRARSNREGRVELRSLEDRLWSKVDKTPTCWLWTGSLMSRGYGEISVDGTTMLAHRTAYQILRGPIPESLTVDHLCRVRRCVNPDHMELVTGSENTRRGQRDAVAARTHCFRGHPWTPENTLSSGGRRWCRTCRRARFSVTRETASHWKEFDPQ